MTGRPSVDTRTRSSGAEDPIDAARFWAGAWPAAVAANGARAAEDAERLRLKPLTISVDGESRTLRLADGTLAGADLTMIAAVRFMHGRVGLPLEEALRMASTYPAAALGVGERRGRLGAGSMSDFVHLSADLEV
jgi:N-acetylglucosamine-6-phosphate deacetylase